MSMRNPSVQFTAMLLSTLAAHSSASAGGENNIDFAAYFDSEVHDAIECSTRWENNQVVFDKAISNPSMSCPDMFSWKLFVDVTRQEWWVNWASDKQTWPKEPFKLCQGGRSGPDCCEPTAASNPGYTDLTSDPEYAASLHCPFFPGDHKATPGAVAAPRRLSAPIGTHAIFLGRGGLAAGLSARTVRPGVIEPGRAIRQEVGEITSRNKSMFEYIFTNELYNEDGLLVIFKRNSENLTKNAPYQATNPAGKQTRIDLPIAAVMIKSNWLYHEFAKQMGLYDDPDNPYVKKNMITEIGDKRYEGEHWLLSFHISTKDTPQWFWATFEHVNNPGRCDFTGCNDSYGFSSADGRRPDGTVDNFTAPHFRNDGLARSSVVYQLGERYVSGPASRALRSLLTTAGVGTSDEVGSEPTPGSSSWLSYRLKGSQVNFTNTMGRATRLGNSITEGGFATTSSCVSCHARAAITTPSQRDKHVIDPALGIFQYDTMSEVGYPQSAIGIPNKDWFHGSGARPSLKALQTDFLWGMALAVKPLASPK